MKPTDPIILICSAIATQEGWFSSALNLPIENDNPGDLDFDGQLNAVAIGRYAKFPTAAMGVAALFRQVWLQVAEGQTLRQLINQWAPTTENNTSAYLQNVLNWTGLPADTPILEFLPPLYKLN